jgi:glycogen(starch) synthase
MAAYRQEVVRIVRVRTRRGAVSAAQAQPRRVLMLAWEYPPRIIGGIARHVDELSKALAAHGIEVDVLTAFHPGAPAEEVMPVGRGRVRVLRASAPPLVALDFVSEIHQLGFGLLERLLAQRQTDYDLVHAHDWLVAFAARTLKHGKGLPLVATIHATEAGRNQGVHTPLQRYIHSIDWLLTYEAQRVICCTRSMRAEVEVALRVPPDKVRTIPNGIDPSRLMHSDSPEDLAAFRRQWAAPEERIVLFVGRLVREKGVGTLLDAMPAVLAVHPEAKFVVAGGGDMRKELVAQAADRGIGAKVVFPGFVSEADLPRLYAVAEVAAFPSLYEPFGIVALEAMAAGVPTVTSDAGGFAEVVRHLETGVHTRAGDPASVAWGISLLLSDAPLRARLRATGRQEARRRFSWKRIAQQTCAVYAEVLGGVAPPKGSWMPAEGGPGVRARYLAGPPEGRS